MMLLTFTGQCMHWSKLFTSFAVNRGERGHVGFLKCLAGCAQGWLGLHKEMLQFTLFL